MFDPTKLRHRLFLIFLVVLIASFLFGAGQVHRDQVTRHRVTVSTVTEVRGWHRQIASELPPAMQDDWRHASDRTPVRLLRLCAYELPAPTLPPSVTD